ncbi:transglycosylase domain-containing protein [Roseobacter sp. HKCC-CH-9208]|uniref:transglycosylase domain-containing protein n=1 Tax=Roseobacter sp. HKCC-CH-9208 TaxID=3120339 RepID=UPI0030EBE2CC
MSKAPSGRRPLVAPRRSSASASRSGSGAAQSARRSSKKKKKLSGNHSLLGRCFRWIGRMVFAVAWRGTLLLALILFGFTLYYYSKLPPVSDLLDARARGSVTMLDRYGEVFAWRGEQFGGAITPDTVSPHLLHAVIATEDRRFYNHFGVSPRGILGAMIINMREGRGPLQGHGGSTITQQVAKLMCLGTPYDPELWDSEAAYEADCRETTIARKLQEVPFALAMEWRYSKDEILSLYFNRAYLGAGTRGFEAAAQRYFGISAAEVNAPQAAMLAGLLVAPSYFAPTRNLERAQERAKVILGLMAREDYLTASELSAARANPATLSDAARDNMGGYFADWIMSEGPSFLTRDTTEDVILRTTFDPAMQRAAEDAINDVFTNQVREGSEAQAAIVVMSADGAVRAMVGGRDLRGAGLFNRATQAQRQTGSAFKPFVYATALDLGWRFDDLILDAPLTLNIPGSGAWSPENYSGEFYGEVTLTEALQASLNTAAVRLSEQVGRDLVRQVASEFGIDSDLAAGPALALGASESSLLEMSGAYAGILNGGSAVTPYGLLELRLMGEDTPLMGQTGGIRERVITDNAARQLIYMMNQVVENGTGQRANLANVEVAGKTGTTNSARDAWFIGFTSDYVAGVWMGYDDNRPLTGVTGGGLPAELWRQTMERIQANQPASPLPMIDPIAEGSRGPNRVLSNNEGTGQVLDGAADLAEQILMQVLGGLLGRGGQ